MWPVERYTDEPLRPFDRVNRYGLMNNMDRWMEHGVMPYWRNADHSRLHVGNTKQVVDDENKFAVSLDVSHFKPNQLKVHIDGRDLTIEGHQEVKTEHGYIKKAFTHKWALPEDCDLDSVHTELDDDGHLCVEAPKIGHHTNRRNLLIQPAKKRWM